MAVKKRPNLDKYRHEYPAKTHTAPTFMASRFYLVHGQKVALRPILGHSGSAIERQPLPDAASL